MISTYVLVSKKEKENKDVYYYIQNIPYSISIALNIVMIQRCKVVLIWYICRFLDSTLVECVGKILYFKLSDEAN